MRLVLPLPPNRANARWHWRQEHRLREKFYEACDLRRVNKADERVPREPVEPYERAEIEVDWYLHGPMDHDNLVARGKWVFDWLVVVGYIRDDKPANIGHPVHRQHIDRKDKRVEITIREGHNGDT